MAPTVSNLDAVIGPGCRLGLLGEAAVPHDDGGTGSEGRPKHRPGGTALEHYAAIDVWLEWSSVCVVDAAGQFVREGYGRIWGMRWEAAYPR
jgi:hypothetical protein